LAIKTGDDKDDDDNDDEIMVIVKGKCKGKRGFV